MVVTIESYAFGRLGMVVAIESANSNPYLYCTTSKEFHQLVITSTQQLLINWSSTMKACGLVLSLALLLSSTPEFTRGGRISII